MVSTSKRQKSGKVMNDVPERISLKDGLTFNITVAITDAAIFNHYVLKEYAPRAQGPLAISKSPAKHTLENCIYDECSGWLDNPSMTGLSVLQVNLTNPAFKNHTLNDEPKVSFSEIIDLMYDVVKLETWAKKHGAYLIVDKERLQQISEKCQMLLKHVDKVDVHEPTSKKNSKQVGTSLRERRVPS